MKTFEGYVQADYSPENWMIMLNAKAEGDKNIDNAASIADVITALSNAQEAMAAINTLLDDAKAAAHASLNAALAGYAQEDYSPENWKILLDTMEGIGSSASVADVTMALNNAQAAMAAVHTLLTDAKIAAHISLDDALAVYKEADYSPDNWRVLNEFKEAGDTAIDEASELAEAEAAQSAAVTGMEGVQTIAGALAAAKSAAHEALAAKFGSYTESDYTADDWSILNGFKEAGDTAIDEASEPAEAEAAQSAAVTGMEGVQTMAGALAAAKSAAHEALAAIFGTYNVRNDKVNDNTAECKVTGDTETDAAAEIVVEETPAVDAAEEVAAGNTVNDELTASQEMPVSNDTSNAAEESSADPDPAVNDELTAPEEMPASNETSTAAEEISADPDPAVSDELTAPEEMPASNDTSNEAEGLSADPVPAVIDELTAPEEMPASSDTPDAAEELSADPDSAPKGVTPDAAKETNA